MDEALLNHACSVVPKWLEDADESEQILALEALQVAVEATKDSAVVSGILPVEAPEFIKSGQSCRCSCSGS